MKNFMKKNNYFGKYSLSANSLDRLNGMKDRTTINNSKMKDAWRSISWEEPEKTNIEDANKNDCHNSQTATSQDAVIESTQATQYAFTQMDRSISNLDSVTSIQNITDFLYESLERSNGKLEMNSLRNIKANDISIIVKDLSKKLSHKGIYNLCNSICSMKIELSERIISFVFKDVLLNAIIYTEEPSRLLNAAITECVAKFPEDVENFIFIPVLNTDLKEISTILSITNNLDDQQKRIYISKLSAEVNDLKQWHIAVLQDLMIGNLDDNIKEKVLNLLWRKSCEFSNDKNYGKLLLNLLKTNPPTTLQQKDLFEEITAVHHTLFKKLMEKILQTI